MDGIFCSLSRNINRECDGGELFAIAVKRDSNNSGVFWNCGENEKYVELTYVVGNKNGFVLAGFGSFGARCNLD